jgi:pimeloyl-[acyl-carrier protein] methyl ester esterase
LVHYESFGRGEKTVVFLHGFGGFGEMWGWQVKDLASAARLIVLDLPGHGKSPWHGEDLEGLAEEIRAVMDQEQVDRAFFVASSFGGLVALRFWEKYPDRVTGLSFVGSVPRFTVDTSYPAGLDAEKIGKLATQLKSDVATALDIFFRSLFTRFERDSLQYGLIKGLRRQAELPDREALLAALEVLETADLRAVLGRVKVPVQFVLGDSDYLCPLALLGPLKALCPSAKFAVVESAGHLPFLSRPEEVNGLLREFIGS